MVDLPLALPAVVNWHEAQAYCAWKSAKDGLTVRGGVVVCVWCRVCTLCLCLPGGEGLPGLASLGGAKGQWDGLFEKSRGGRRDLLRAGCPASFDAQGGGSCSSPLYLPYRTITVPYCTAPHRTAQGVAAYRLATEPEHAALRHVEARDAEGRAAVDPVMARSGVDFRCGRAGGRAARAGRRSGGEGAPELLC